jgi:hypothetical protein
MVARNPLVIGLLAAAIASPAVAQGDPQAVQMQMQVQQIMQSRPPSAEFAGREFLQRSAPDLIPALDSLKQASVDEYWMELAQLVAQASMVSNIASHDTVRAQLVTRMFSLEAHARGAQRAYRAAPDGARPAIRKQIEAWIGQHFDLEDQLRALEISDIERRLAQVRAESQRRRDKRSEFIQFAVDDIIRDAVRPR